MIGCFRWRRNGYRRLRLASSHDWYGNGRCRFRFNSSYDRIGNSRVRRRARRSDDKPPQLGNRLSLRIDLRLLGSDLALQFGNQCRLIVCRRSSSVRQAQQDCGCNQAVGHGCAASSR
jgi:hypothetical protein